MFKYFLSIFGKFLNVFIKNSYLFYGLDQLCKVLGQFSGKSKTQILWLIQIYKIFFSFSIKIDIFIFLILTFCN